MTILMLCVSLEVLGESSSLNLNIPSSPQSYQSDRIRSGTLECQMAIGSSTNMEFGVVGILNQNGPYDNNYYNFNDPNFQPNSYSSDSFVKDVGVYAKITIPIGAPEERLNCNTLYRLELQRRQLEIQKLEAEVANLRRLQSGEGFANE